MAKEQDLLLEQIASILRRLENELQNARTLTRQDGATKPLIPDLDNIIAHTRNLALDHCDSVRRNYERPRVLLLALTKACEHALDLARDSNLVRIQALDLTRVRDGKLAAYRSYTSNRDITRDCDRVHTIERIIDLAFDLAFNLALASVLGSTPIRHLDINLALVNTCNHARARKHAADDYFNNALESAFNRARALTFDLGFVSPTILEPTHTSPDAPIPKEVQPAVVSQEVSVDSSDKALVTSNTPPDPTLNLHNRLREVLAQHLALVDDRALRAVFVDKRLAPWRNRAPEATPDRATRVAALIDTLYDKANIKGENALVLFLRVLADQTDPDDALHRDLSNLAKELEQEFMKDLQ